MPANTQPIRWGMVGCGDVTQEKSAPAYQMVEGFRLDAVMARTPGKAKTYAQTHNIARYFDDANMLIHDPDIDAVYIATPPDSHHALALEVAQAGKICCVEKPMAQTLAQCQAMCEAFSERNLPLFVAYYRRCLPAFRQLKTLLSRHALGEIRHIDWQYRRPFTDLDKPGEYNWRTDPTVAASGYFDDLACHGLDLFCYLFGEVQAAKGFALNQGGHYRAHDGVTATLLFKNAVTASAAWHFNCHDKIDQVTVAGSKGTLSFSVFSSTPAVVKTADGEQALPMPKPTPVQLPFVEAMQRALVKGEAHPCTGASAMHCNWIMAQILS